jgi:hypothetical protein
VPSANPYANAGFVKADGTRVPSRGLLAARSFYKRLYNIMVRFYPDAANSVFHSSGMPNMAYEAFGGRFWTDENLNSRINDKQPDYRGLVTPAMFRTEYMGRNFGNLSGMIGQGRIKAETCFKNGVTNVWDHIKGLCLLHDMEPNATGWHIDYRFSHNKKFRKLIRERDAQALLGIDIYMPEFKFIPYWDERAVEMPKDMYASFYVRRGKKEKWDLNGLSDPVVVAIFCNESDYSGELKLRVDWRKLGLDPSKGLKAVNAVHRVALKFAEPKPDADVWLQPDPKETAEIAADGTLAFPISEWNYRMIIVRQK